MAYECHSLAISYDRGSAAERELGTKLSSCSDEERLMIARVKCMADSIEYTKADDKSIPSL